MKYLADVAGIFPPCGGILQIGKSFLNRVIVPILFLWILLIEFLPYIILFGQPRSINGTHICQFVGKIEDFDVSVRFTGSSLIRRTIDFRCDSEHFVLFQKVLTLYSFCREFRHGKSTFAFTKLHCFKRKNLI